MSEPVRALTLQMLEWISSQPRTYGDVMVAWRTTCPRMSIWEDACIDGLIERPAGSEMVEVSRKGKALLNAQRKVTVSPHENHDS